MDKYKFKKTAGALQEAYDEPAGKSMMAQSNIMSQSEIDDLLSSVDSEYAEYAAPPPPMMQSAPAAFRSAESTGEFMVNDLVRASMRAQSVSPQRNTQIRAAAPHVATGIDPHWQNQARHSMFFYTVEEGKRVMMTNKNGSMKVITGPARVWRVGRRFRAMQHYTAHPSEFLIVRFRDGRQEHLAGPAHVWMDPREHKDITMEEALPIADKEAVIVYAEDEETGEVARRIVHGPATFVPKPGEWLHTFKWHGNVGGRKVPGALEFQKLWLLPDQMYHDVPDVRTADDAVLTIRLMMFFELVDIELMLSETHDPIGDFLNAATSDVVDFVGRHSFESFKQNTEKLNELATYKQLISRAEQIGYRVNRVVYRGYGAKASLEQMHDQAIESRTKLQLEKATEQQAQELEDLKLERNIARGQKEREDKRRSADAELEMQAKARDFNREQVRLDAEQRDRLAREADQRRQEHLAALAGLGVDLTQYLTQDRADKVIEVRGNGAQPHVHLQND